MNESFAQKATITLLTEGESKRKHHRKRLAQSFTTPDLNSPQPKRQKKHSPNFENVCWDKEKLENTLRNWPPSSPINWSAVARQHNIEGGNGGQVVQEFAAEKGIIIAHIQNSTLSRQLVKRSSKKRLTGCDVSIPANPPVATIDKEIRSMISSSRFTLGEECVPYKSIRYVPKNGKIVQEVFIKARKISLREIRESSLPCTVSRDKLPKADSRTGPAQIKTPNRTPQPLAVRKNPLSGKAAASDSRKKPSAEPSNNVPTGSNCVQESGIVSALGELTNTLKKVVKQLEKQELRLDSCSVQFF